MCVACEKRMLSVFSACGRRLLPPILLPSPISTLHCTGPYVMALTAAATLSVWDVHRQVVVVKEESLHSILAGVRGPSGVGAAQAGAGVTGLPAKAMSKLWAPLLRGLVPADRNMREPSVCLIRKRHDGISDLADTAWDPRDEPVGRQGLLLQPVAVHVVSSPPLGPARGPVLLLSTLWGPVLGGHLSVPGLVHQHFRPGLWPAPTSGIPCGCAGRPAHAAPAGPPVSLSPSCPRVPRNLVSDKQDSLVQCADFRSSLPPQDAMLCSGPLAIVQGRAST